MTFLPAPVAFPADADPGPIVELGAALARVADELGDAGETIGIVARQTESYWTGRAAEHFRTHLGGRHDDLDRASAALADADPALREFAGAIERTEAAHARATFWFRTAAAALPPLPPAALTAMYLAAREQREAVEALQAAGARCAARLDRIRRALGGCVDADGGRGRSNRSSVDRFVDGARDVQMSGDVIAGGIGGAGTGLGHALNRWSHDVTRLGTTFRRWNPRSGGTTFGLTAGEATRRARMVGRWGKVTGVGSALFSGGLQALEDSEDRAMSDETRVRRVVAATVVEGGSSWAMGAAGAKGGAIVGAMVGGPVGAVVGGAIGGIGGAIAGSELGGWLKRRLFSENPGGLFR